MIKNTVNKLLIVCGLLAIVSCKAHKQLVVNKADTSAVKPGRAVEIKLNSIKEAQLNFNTFAGKAKTRLTINNSSNDVTMNIRINKGHKIWISITAIAGIEVARALITPDSIIVINKLQGLYLRKPFSYIYNYVGEQLDYSSVEAIFVGNAIPQLLNDNAQLAADSGNVNLSGKLDQLMYKLVVGPDLKAGSTSLSDPDAGQSVQVNNTIMMPVANRVMPSQIDISSAIGAKKIKISMHYVKMDFDLPLEYPFNIPDGYSPAK
jgi:hypothetical protein